MCISDNKRVEMASNLSHEEMQSVLNELNLMWEARNFIDAVCLFEKYIDVKLEDKIEVQFKAGLCSLFTNICDLAKTEKLEECLFSTLESSLEKTVEYLSDNLSQIQKIFKEGIANYNYATSLSILYSFKRIKNNDYLLPINTELLVRAKRQFWIAIRASKNKMKLEMMVNLAHVLSDCYRISECLYLYDKVIEIEPTFPQANYSKAKSLEFLSKLSSGYSINQIYEIFNHYKAASMSSIEFHPFLKESARIKSEQTYNVLLKHGYDYLTIEKDRAKNLQEFLSHSEKRQFYIKNGMALSEHSLYCGCNGAARDSLTILKSSHQIEGEFVPRLEHVLNQLKTEYFKARDLFFNSQFKSDHDYKQDNYELCLTDLGNFEVSGLRSEDLRLAFKSCFGILDKIALSVCELFDFSVDENEKIYFESFWKKQHERDKDIKEKRWSEVNSIEDNPSLFALYFQSTDLDSKKGEWKNFKTWRNALEHGYFVLTSSQRIEAPYGILDRDFIVVHAEYDFFKDRTSELLRFVRSAIFNFTFCIRREAEKSVMGDNLVTKIPVNFSKKYDIKGDYV